MSLQAREERETALSTIQQYGEESAPEQGATTTAPESSNHVQPTVEPDHFVDDGYDDTVSDVSSYVSSLATQISRGIEENGRLYPSMETKHMSPTPMDDMEMDRNDLQHAKFTLLLGGLFISPVQELKHVLDLGTGSGKWAIDMADKYEDALIYGADIAPSQPSWVPPNCFFEIFDIEEDWQWKKNHFDLIYVRELIFAVRDWGRLFEQAMLALKPGGYIEVGNSVPIIGSDDGTKPPNTAYEYLADAGIEIGNSVGASSLMPLKWKEMLEKQGFEDVQQHIFKIPTNPWPKDKVLKQVGLFELHQFTFFLRGLYLRGWTQALGRSPEELEAWFARARKEVANKKMHTYIHFYVVFGRKPQNS